MAADVPRGIAVVDIGATNSKVALFDAGLQEIARRKTETVHHDGPPYRHIDAQRIVEFAIGAIGELDRVLPVDVIVVSAFGSTLGCVDDDGRAGDAGDGLSRRAAGGDRRRRTRRSRRPFPRRSATPGRGAVARPPALLARDRLSRGVRARAVDHDLEPVSRFPPRRPADLRDHRARAPSRSFSTC